MNYSTKIYKLEGKVQHYLWGGSTFIPQLLQQENHDHRPFAEYWMGAHDNVPSIVVTTDGEKIPLNRFIAAHPIDILGNTVQTEFARLPYLFKVLDVKDMLSIQVHPTKAAAVAEFAAENKKGTALDASNRNYKDDNHKPELMYALGDFWLLHGFKPVAELQNTLQQVSELQFLLPEFGEGDYPRVYNAVMLMPQEEVNARLKPLLERIIPLYEQGKLQKTQADFWAARAALTFNQAGKTDRGIFSVYLFNLVHLQEGDSIFQDAGIPHAYLEGQNMEIMANSDNVLRGGLTPKHIDLGELMKHVKFQPVSPVIIKGTTGEVSAETRFPTPAADFELRRIRLAAGHKATVHATTAEIFFVYEGSGNFRAGDTGTSLKKGEVLLAILGAAVEIEAAADLVVFRATVPEKDSSRKN